ncbi:MAG: hypothetical protein NZ958_06295 [Bacteroidia bacterium]|nr:hypothetical protein [Bacteroidia bacterium]MDW8088772.1 hypothetical protein [Bacteroidia bacterium]
MGLRLLLWMQTWSIPTPYRQVVQDLKVWPVTPHHIWLGYRATRAGTPHLYLHYIDTALAAPSGSVGLCVSCRETTRVEAWDAAVSETGGLYGAWSSAQGTFVFSLEKELFLGWQTHLGQPAKSLQLQPKPKGGVVLLLQTENALSLHYFSATGMAELKEVIEGGRRPVRHGRLLLSDAEGFIVLWEAYTGRRWELFFQKWLWKGEAVSSARSLTGTSRSVETAEFLGDGYGGLIAAYEGLSMSGIGKDLYLVRYNRHGQQLYEVPLCTEAGDQQNPRLYKRGAEVWVVWEDNRRQDWDLYYQRFDITTGQPLLPKEGLPIVSLPGPQQNPQLILNYLQNELIAVWVDFRRMQGDIYFQRYSAQGKPLWEFTGRPLADNLYMQHSLCVAALGFQDFWVAYLEEHPTEGSYVYVAHISLQGEVRLHRALGGNREQPLAQIGAIEAVPWGDKLLLLWSDNREGKNRRQLYGQLLNAELEPQWPKLGQPLGYQPNLLQEEAQAIFLGDTAWILWRAEESIGESDLYAQAFTSAGRPLFPRPLSICDAKRHQHEPRWLLQGGRLYAYWTDSRSLEESGFDLYLRPIWPLGPEQGWRTLLTFQNSALLFPGSDSGRLHHLWQEEVQGKYQILYAYGALGEVGGGLALVPTAKPQRFFQALQDSLGNVWVAFCEEAPGPYQQTLRVVGISPKGEILWRQIPPLTHTHHLYPRLDLLGPGEVVLTFLGQRSDGRWELAYGRYSPQGTLLKRGLLLTPVPEKTSWQIGYAQGRYWLLGQIEEAYVLYQGTSLDNLRPVPLAVKPAQAKLLLWRQKPWLFWVDPTRTQLHLMPLVAMP